MIGIYGASQITDENTHFFNAYFSLTNHGKQHSSTSDLLIGGNYHNDRNLFISEDYIVVSDSDNQVLSYLNQTKRLSGIISYKGIGIEINSEISGSLGIYDKINRKLVLYSDWANSYPLYYAFDKNILSFSSHLGPLARILKQGMDWVGAMEFMLLGYCIGGRTPISGVQRLMPGQYVVYDLNTKKMLKGETSRLWTSSEDLTQNKFADIWEDLKNDCQKHIHGQDLALMLSGGWDSRLVLAAIGRMPFGNIAAATYSFGSKENQEMNLSGRLASEFGLRHHPIQVPPTVYGLDYLQKVFKETENILFPAWYYCAEKLEAIGYRNLTSGIHGEILGGRYGVGDWGEVYNQVKYLLYYLLLKNKKSYYGQNVEPCLNFMRKYYNMHPWYATDSFWEQFPNFIDKMTGDIETEVQRHLSRGAVRFDQVMEALRAEHLGFNSIACQSIAARSRLNVYMPFAKRALMEKTSNLNFRERIHNSLSRKLLMKYAPSLCRYPTASILVDTQFPILVQEATRFLKRMYEDYSWSKYIRTRGQSRLPNTDYMDLESLRKNRVLDEVVDDIDLEFINGPLLKNKFKQFYDFKFNQKSRLMCFQLIKIYTINLLNRDIK